LNPGIEATAQALALNAVGRTLAVLNHGPDRIYPREFRPLAQSIREKGLLVSEHPPGTRLQKERFPRRNRILSGLSVGVLVVEAELSSPARAIAETALEQGREVFAVPGSIHLPQKKGCHFLIRQGANLVETAEDVLKHLHPTLQHLKF
jgi:DNA processing protein